MVKGTRSRKVSKSRARRQTRKVSKSRTRRQTRKVSKTRTRRQTRNVEQIGGMMSYIPCFGDSCKKHSDNLDDKDDKDDEDLLLEHEQNPPFQGNPNEILTSPYQKEIDRYTAFIESLTYHIEGLKGEEEVLKDWLNGPTEKDKEGIASAKQDIISYRNKIRKLEKERVEAVAKLEEAKANMYERYYEEDHNID